jgi:hypothetical protein
MSFYIEKVIASGSGKKDSIIELKKGVNIIYGPSNTGKTYIVKCIDFLFGSAAEPIDITTGYEYIKLIVKTKNGSVTMNRKIGENNIEVSSTDSKVSSGTYSSKAGSKNYEKTINSVWLSLIKIEQLHYVIKNENYQKQVLSWRIFCHMFLLKETKIIIEESAILPGRNTSNTAALSSLIFLLTGEDFEKTEAGESKEIKKAKKSAVKTYINKELFRLSERNQELAAQLDENSDVDLKQEVEEITAKIADIERRINESIENNQETLSKLHLKNEEISECNVLLNRYKELSTQYAADLKRLSFIVDGEANIDEKFLPQCPFCNGEIDVSETHNYIDAAKADYKKIKLQARDLEKASGELTSEKIGLKKEIDILMKKKKSTEALIEIELRPQISLLKEKLTAYKEAIELQNEIAILKRIAAQKTSDIIENESDGENEQKFRVKEHLDYDFFSELGTDVYNLLEECKYENLHSVIFSKADMDIVINGKKKSANGKGYNAYFNSIVAIILSRYMNEKAKHPPNFLVLDSPILSLKEKESKMPSETMRNYLFENIVNNQRGIQTIIVENEIPNIDYKSTNIIHFTKEKNKGRYGFLLGVTD